LNPALKAGFANNESVLAIDTAVMITQAAELLLPGIVVFL